MENPIAGFTMLVAIFTFMVIFVGLHTNVKRVNKDNIASNEFRKHIESEHAKLSRLHKHKPESEIEEDLSFYLID